MSNFQAAPGRLTILCAEDEAELRRDLAEELREAGYDVLEAANGEEALMAITTLLPDLVLCDINMPKMSGLDVLERIRASDGVSAEVPFIFLTAYGEKADLIRGRSLGADDYLVKPVDYDLLLATITARMASLARAKRRSESRVLALEHQLFDMLQQGVPGRTTLADGASLRQLLAQPALPACLLALVSLDAYHRLAPQFGAAAAQRLLDSYLDLLRDVAPGLAVQLFQLEGDAFALLVEGDQLWGQIGDRLWQLVDTTLDVTGQRLPITSTLAVAEYRATDPRPATDMLDDTRLALQFARRDGGRTLVRVDGETSGRLQVMEFVEKNFVRALAAGELFLAFQPKIDLRTGRPAGGEALVRWHSPERGLIPPATFIPIIERTGFVDLVSDWVLDKAAAAIATLARDDLSTTIAVNASGAELHARFVDRVDAVIRRHAIAPAGLEIEITETSVVLDMEFAAGITRQLRERGLSVVIDDFGTGYSSLAYLRSFPLDGVKIDQTFVRGMASHAIDRQIVSSVIGLARAIGLKTVAEGIETPAERDLVKSLGCDFGQGFLFARPLPFDDFRHFLKG